jgi:hypothetical protein
MACHTTETELRALAAEGLSFRQMSERLDIPATTIQVACSCLGIRSIYRPPTRRGMVHVNSNEYVADLLNGLTLDEIAKKHGKASGHSVRAALNKRGLPATREKLQAMQAKAA